MAVLSAMRAHKHRLLSLLLVRAQARVRGVCGVRAACAQHAASARERRHAGGAAEGEKTSGSLGVDLPHASGDGGHLEMHACISICVHEGGLPAYASRSNIQFVF